MELNITQEGSKYLITIAGKLSVITSPDLEAAIREMPEDVTDIDIDLSELEYISSAGLRVLVVAQKLCISRGGDLRLLNPNDEVSEVFEMTGLADVFTIVS